jgi:hypothetical protein
MIAQLLERWSIFVCALGAALFVGCARSDMVEVSGTVTFNGAPVPDGEIIFFPQDKAVAPAAGRITKGAYRFMSKAGMMRVEIQAARSTGKRDPVDGFLISELYIPAQYNKQSTLSAEVRLDAENHFDFALTDKPAQRGTTP